MPDATTAADDGYFKILSFSWDGANVDDFGKANWLNKARQQPDKVRMVLIKLKQTDFRLLLKL